LIISDGERIVKVGQLKPNYRCKK